MKKSVVWVFVLFPVLAFGITPEEAFIQEVVGALKANTQAVAQYGAYQTVITTKLDGEGKAKRVEEKNLRTVWISGKAHNELVKADCREFESRTGKSRRCYDFIKASAKKSDKPGKLESEVKKVRWSELHRNFDFTVQSNKGPYREMSFKPKSKGISTEGKLEKLLASMAGTVWVDEDYNIVRAEAKLVDPVSFGLGVAAKVNHLSIRYHQQDHGTVFLPASLSVEFHAKVALVHSERQRIEVFWTEPYHRTSPVWASAGTVPVSGKNK